jgi:hypothetical protein
LTVTTSIITTYREFVIRSSCWSILIFVPVRAHSPASTDKENKKEAPEITIIKNNIINKFFFILEITNLYIRDRVKNNDYK